MSPGFAEDRLVYLTYAEAGEDGRAGTAAGRGRLSADKRRLEGFHVIFRQLPKLSSGHHFGSRLVFDGKGHLFIALGENNQRSTSQDLDKLQGKVVRLYPDGGVPKDNPFVGRTDARPEIWSYGHRNQQGAALNPWTGRLWTHEHGRAAATRSTYPRPAGTTAGRWRPMESTTPCCRSPKPGQGRRRYRGAAPCLGEVAGDQRHGVLRCAALPGLAA